MPVSWFSFTVLCALLVNKSSSIKIYSGTGSPTPTLLRLFITLTPRTRYLAKTQKWLPNFFLYSVIVMSDGRFVLNRVYLHRGANDPRLLTIPPSWRQFQQKQGAASPHTHQSENSGYFKSLLCNPLYGVTSPRYSPIMICINRSDERV